MYQFMVIGFGLIFQVFLTFLILGSNHSGRLIKRLMILLLLSLILFDLNTLFFITDNSILLLDGTLLSNAHTSLLSILLFLAFISFLLIDSPFFRSELYLIILADLMAFLYLFLSLDWLITIIAWEFFNFSLYLFLFLGSRYEASISASMKYF
jgi:NADH:ubiquinone oxidoreductase subunit 2 (subunit N)